MGPSHLEDQQTPSPPRELQLLEVLPLTPTSTRGSKGGRTHFAEGRQEPSPTGNVYNSQSLVRSLAHAKGGLHPLKEIPAHWSSKSLSTDPSTGISLCSWHTLFTSMPCQLANKAVFNGKRKKVAWIKDKILHVLGA